MERYEINKWIEEKSSRVEDLKKAIKPEQITKRLSELAEQMQAPNFWNDSNEAKKVTKESSQLEKKHQTYQSLESQLNDILAFAEASKDDNEMMEMLLLEMASFDEVLKSYEVEVLLSGPYDNQDVILEIHPGAGGTESQDWADMLYRMYQRFAQRRKFKMELLDYQSGDEAGIKSVTLRLKGDYAYGYLKAEHGVHRLVRISPFDSNQRRHTSFASVEIMPDIDDDIDIDIKDDDIKIDVYRSSGAGGQSVNTTDSAVRITHLKTNIVVTCQNERSQIKNKETAMRLLKAKLMQEEIKKQEAELKAIKGEQVSIGWGSQIRSYVFHPYQMVKDHRTNHETALIQDVMDGALNPFINAYLKS
ncbi:MAG: peptide chain release factor 2 [Acholeplasmataceae bacterium]